MKLEPPFQDPLAQLGDTFRAAQSLAMQVNAGQEALTTGLLAQLKRFDDADAGAMAAVQRLNASQDALTSGLLAQLKRFDDADAGAVAAVQRLNASQDALTSDLSAQLQRFEDAQAGSLVAAQVLNASQKVLVDRCFEGALALWESADLPACLPNYVESLFISQKLLESTYGSAFQTTLGWNLEDTIGASLAAFRGGLAGPDFALLTGNDRGGLLSLVGQSAISSCDRSLLSAPLLPAALEACRGPRGRVIRVRCNVTCQWCGSPMITSGRDHVVDEASFEMTIDLSVVPLCPTCLRRAEADPAYLDVCLSDTTEAAPSRLKLIRGSAESTGEPLGRAVLHLVKPTGESEDK
jgi:hypothetical protein